MPQLAVIQAPPGAGKTALLREAARLAEADGAAVFDIPPAALAIPDGLRDCVLSQLSCRERWRDLIPALRFGVAGRPGAAVTVFLDGLLSLSELRGPDSGGPTSVLLLVDEAQELAARDPATVAILLGALREKPGLATATILAGLPETVDALRSPSLARAEHQFALGALGRSDSLELLSLWLRDNGFDAEGPESLDRIAAHAQDWPEHLMHHVRAMLEAAAENRGVVDGAVVARANAAANAPMRAYYQGRLRALSDRPLEEERALTALAVTAGGPQADIVSEDAKQIVRAAGAEEGVLRRLRHAGVLVEQDRRLRFAIPSLRRYVLDTGRPLTPNLAVRVAELTSQASPDPSE